MIVADATPLIHLARAGQLDLLPKVYERVPVPRSVWAEIVPSREPSPEGPVFEKASESWLDVRELSAGELRVAGSLRRGAPLGRGESEAIALAEPLRTPVLMDDTIAIGVARARGLETRWTTSVILEAHRREILNTAEARLAIEELVRGGLWLRQDVLLRLLAILGD